MNRNHTVSMVPSDTHNLNGYSQPISPVSFLGGASFMESLDYDPSTRPRTSRLSPPHLASGIQWLSDGSVDRPDLAHCASLRTHTAHTAPHGVSHSGSQTQLPFSGRVSSATTSVRTGFQERLSPPLCTCPYILRPARVSVG